MLGLTVLGLFGCGKKRITAVLICLLIFEAFSGVLSAVVKAIPLAEAAVVVIEGSPNTDAPSHTAGGSQTVFLNDLVGYKFFRSSGGACQYRKSTNSGASWGTAVSIDTQTDCVGVAVWYDQWTPGDTGTTIHIVTMDTSDDDLFYNSLNTTNDTLGSTTARAVETVGGTTATYASNSNRPAITKGTNGVVYVGADDATGTGTTIRQCSSNCTITANWSDAGTPPQGNANSWTMYMPLSGGDIMQVNRSTTNLLRYSVWNGSSWTSYQNIDAAAVRGTTYDVNMAMTMDRDNYNIFLAYITDANDFITADHDVRTAVYSGGSWSSTTAVVTDSPRGIHQVAIARDENTGYLYLGYTARTTIGTAATANVYWHMSTTSMSSWGAENGPLNTVAGDLYGIDFNLMSNERIYASWFDNVTAVRDIIGETVADIGPDVTVSATGTPIATVRAETNNFYVGGKFMLQSRATRTVSQLIVTEAGTVDGQNDLDNIRLYYETDTSAPYNCLSESYAGTEAQFGATSTNSFSSANGTTSFSVSPITISSTTALCLYPVVDVLPSADNASTIALQIASPRNDVTVSDGLVFPVSAAYFSGTTTVSDPNLTQSHYHWRSDNGTEVTASSATNGVQDTALAAVQKNSPRRLRLEISNEGSTTSLPVNFVLQYGVAAPTCDMVSSWSVIGSTTPWLMYNSANLTNGANTTNIATSSGGVADENTTFLSANAGVLDLTPTSSSLTLATTSFVELEYSIVATTSAIEGETYCFRATRSGIPLGTYSVYPQATVAADVTVSATGTQATTTDAGAANVYLGGAFRIIENTGSRTITGITLSETGTVAADTDIDNVRLYYEMDNTAPYDCASVSYGGGESTFGVTNSSFNGPDGQLSLSGSVAVSTTNAFCGYVVVDVANTATNTQTLNVRISSPSSEVVVSSGSVGPTTPVDVSGTTTIRGGILTQTGYHWRSDNGSETSASSATGAENTALSGFLVGDAVRLRFGVSNEGPTSSAPTRFQLEFATKVTTCGAVSSWTAVGASTDDWDMKNSVNLTNGSSTTNIATSTGGVSDANSLYLSTNTGVRDTTDITSSTTLLSTNFVDLEYSITSSLYTAYETTYCFRVSAEGASLPAYDNYAELTTSEKRDFKIQRGFFFATTSTTTLVAGVDYTAPSSSDRAFIQITNIHNTGAGRSAGNATQNSDDVTIYISDASNITSSVSFARPSPVVDDTRVSWEIIEFIGKPNTDNEIKVRQVGTLSFGSTATTATSSVISSVVDDSKVVVFVTGVRDRGAVTNYYAGLVTSEWSSSTNQAVFRRGASGSAIADVSYAVVEFTGENWAIQRSEHLYVSSAGAETENITPVNSLARTFMHVQKRMGANAAVRNFGHEVWLSSIGVVSFQLEASALTTIEQTSVAWIIENTQQGDGAMAVQRQSGNTSGGAEPLSLSVGITTNLVATNNSSISGNGRGAGTAAATTHPRGHAGLRITSTSTFEIWRSDTGTALTYRVEFIEWPTSNFTLRQNYYRIYTDNNELTPDDPWPAGGTNIGENIPITVSDEPLGWGEEARLRTTIRASGANVYFGSLAPKLQYGLRSSTCSAISSWFDLGGASSSTAWRGYSATGTVDGTELSTDPATNGDLLISTADTAATLEHENPAASNPYTLLEGNELEYDWYISHNGAQPESTYCFRMVAGDGSALDGYFHYPEVRTAGYTPVTRNWRWYDDTENVTPTIALANENVAPADVANGSTLTLRVAVAETKGASEADVRFKLQYSNDASFSTSTDVVSTSTCMANSLWCYFAGAATDNATISSSTLSDASSCSAGVGVGCGVTVISPTYYSGHTHYATSTQEYSFTLRQAGARVRAVYYFRLYDTLNNAVVPLGSGENYPSLLTEAPTLSLAVASMTPGTTTAGVAITTTSTPSSVSFGQLQLDQDYIAGHRLSVNTNATDGYQLFFYARQQLLNSYGDAIAPIIATNSAPVAWLTGCPLSTSTGCVGYHTTDPTLAAGSGRFAPDNSYAGLSTTPQEIMWSSLPSNESHNIIYRMRVGEKQPAGDYSSELVYLVIPTY